MDMSLFRFNDDTNTVEILTPGHNQTIEALEFLVKKGYIPDNFQHAYFTCNLKPLEGAKLKLKNDYGDRKYSTVIIYSIKLKNVEPEVAKYDDADCAVKILKMFDLYIFESIESVLYVKENYVFNGKYNILVDKSGLFRWETQFGAHFIYD